MQAPRVVGEGAGVDDDRRAPAGGRRGSRRPARPRGCSARASTSSPCRRRPRSAVRHVVGERRRAVDLRLAVAQQVEVRSVQQQHDRRVHRPRDYDVHRVPRRRRRPDTRWLEHRIASARSIEAGTHVGLGDAGDDLDAAGPSSTNVSPSSAFLSRPISATQLVGVDAGRDRRSAARTCRRRRPGARRPGRRRCARAVGPARRRRPARCRPPRRG